ncbi:MAG TPA: hypothetical protein VGR14_11790 [Verrucomicrobiae bacterium]|jgi:hypothetical protein|nr:hypothetical protein [Verrucomicrobiae bacterium]
MTSHDEEHEDTRTKIESGAGGHHDLAARPRKEHRERILLSRALCGLLWPVQFWLFQPLFPLLIPLQNVKEQAPERLTPFTLPHNIGNASTKIQAQFAPGFPSLLFAKNGL